MPQIARGGRFELRGLAPGKEYPVHFLDAEHRLGATAHLKTDRRKSTVVLHPCGQAVARFVDKNGQPVTDHHPMIEIVVTPGFLEDYSIARKMGALSADVEFISNVDRTDYSIYAPLKSDKQGRVHLPALIPGASLPVQSVAGRMGTNGEIVRSEGQRNARLGRYYR